jgi:hypothetical protein
MKYARSIQITCPWTNIVTTQGSAPWIPAPNDGVVTITSQCKREDIMELIELDCNHYEIVLNDHVVNIIKNKIQNY